MKCKPGRVPALLTKRDEHKRECTRKAPAMQIAFRIFPGLFQLKHIFLAVSGRQGASLCHPARGLQ